MGRPADVSDDEVIAAGLKVQQNLLPGRAVTATALWSACGKRGRPDRLLAVWRSHESAHQAENPAAAALPPALPDAARQKLAACMAALAQSLEQTAASVYVHIEQTFEGRYRSELEALARARTEMQAERAEALDALGDAGERLIELQTRIAQLQAELATSRQQESVHAERRRQDTEARNQGAARIKELEARQVELERKLAASEARENQTSKRADQLSDQMAEARCLAEAQREELGETHGRLKAQEERIHELSRALEQEQAKRFELEVKLARGVQVLAGGPSEASHRSKGAAPPPTRSRYPSPKRIRKDAAMTAPAEDGAAGADEQAVADEVAST